MCRTKLLGGDEKKQSCYIRCETGQCKIKRLEFKLTSCKHKS